MSRTRSAHNPFRETACPSLQAQHGNPLEELRTRHCGRNTAIHLEEPRTRHCGRNTAIHLEEPRARHCEVSQETAAIHLEKPRTRHCEVSQETAAIHLRNRVPVIAGATRQSISRNRVPVIARFRKKPRQSIRQEPRWIASPAAPVSAGLSIGTDSSTEQ